ncbi:hypothetical protein MMC07_003305 [Pseudocyphellaria aurata]|nr:hypothetical protein [Pseudocyphellaria aurata]
MAANPLRVPSIFSLLSPCCATSQCCIRQIHHQVAASRIPSPTPFVPDSKTFLTLIGRNLAQQAAKVPTWDSLFSLTSAQLREVGVEPARTRRYLLWWRNRFRNGIYGIGGDLRHVANGIAKLRVVEVPRDYDWSKKDPSRIGLGRKKKLVVDLPPEIAIDTVSKAEVYPVKGFKVRGAHTIVGPYITLNKNTRGSEATLAVCEGMWEEKRGIKVDGGERRRKQVRYERRIEENRKKRE